MRKSKKKVPRKSGGQKTSRKKGSNKNKPRLSLRERFANEIERDTLKGVLSVLLLTFAVILFMAAFSMAGKFGDAFYRFAHSLFGFGYYLIPSSFLIMATAIYKAREKSVGVVRSIALFFFFVSSLALLELAFTSAGGSLGALVLSPVLYAFDKVAGAMLLTALAVASLFVVFDTHPVKLLNTLRINENGDGDSELLDKTEEEIVERAVQKVKPKEKETSPEDKGSKKNTKLNSVTENIKKVVSKSKDALDIQTTEFHAGYYKLPPLKLLRSDKGRPSVGDVKANANRIKQTLENFNIPVEMDEITIGPTVTRYAMKPAEGVRLNKILGLQSNLELALAASPIRIEAPIPGKSLVGIEVPNSGKITLGLASIIGNSEFYSDKYLLPMALGKEITGKAVIADLAKAPHMIIAGATGAGKSVTIHDLIISFLYKYGPEKLRLILVDPKMVELTLYNGIPHLLTPVITDAKKTILTLKWLISEMERRYEILMAHKVQNLKSYHEQIYQKALDKGVDDAEMPEALPYIVTVLDELADIMQMYPKELESAIVRIAQKARAVGIHLILATQRPDVRTITGLIKANVPTRIALQVPSQIDSRTILDQAGAEKLLGAGDMLFLGANMSKPKRIQAPFVTTQEIKELVKFISKSYEGELQDEIDFESLGSDSVAFSSGNLLEDDDERNTDEYKAVLEFVVSARKASTSLLQRKFRIGYNKAARFIDIMEEDGIIGPQNGSKPREVLVESLDELGATEQQENMPSDNMETQDDDLTDLIEDIDNQEQEGITENRYADEQKLNDNENIKY